MAEARTDAVREQQPSERFVDFVKTHVDPKHAGKRWDLLAGDVLSKPCNGVEFGLFYINDEQADPFCCIAGTLHGTTQWDISYYDGTFTDISKDTSAGGVEIDSQQALDLVAELETHEQAGRLVPHAYART